MKEVYLIVIAVCICLVVALCLIKLIHLACGCCSFNKNRKYICFIYGPTNRISPIKFLCSCGSLSCCGSIENDYYTNPDLYDEVLFNKKDKKINDEQY